MQKGCGRRNAKRSWGPSSRPTVGSSLIFDPCCLGAEFVGAFNWIKGSELNLYFSCRCSRLASCAHLCWLHKTRETPRWCAIYLPHLVVFQIPSISTAKVSISSNPSSGLNPPGFLSHSSNQPPPFHGSQRSVIPVPSQSILGNSISSASRGPAGTPAVSITGIMSGQTNNPDDMRRRADKQPWR